MWRSCCSFQPRGLSIVFCTTQLKKVENYKHNIYAKRRINSTLLSKQKPDNKGIFCHSTSGDIWNCMCNSYVDQRWYKPPNCYSRLCYIQSLKTIWKDGSTWVRSKIVRGCVPYVVSCFCVLKVRNAYDVGIIFQEFCWEFSIPVLGYS
jgi:hypothetical protein